MMVPKMNLQSLAALTTIGLATGTVTYQMGDFLSRLVTVEAESRSQRDIIFEIHGKVCGIEKDIKHIDA